MKPPHVPIKSRKKLIAIGLVLFLIGSYMLWDAWEGRGKGTPFPLGVLTPF